MIFFVNVSNVYYGFEMVCLTMSILLCTNATPRFSSRMNAKCFILHFAYEIASFKQINNNYNVKTNIFFFQK